MKTIFELVKRDYSLLGSYLTVEALLKSKNADVVNFIRFEVGEGIEKKSEDFAAEVAAQLEAAKK